MRLGEVFDSDEPPPAPPRRIASPRLILTVEEAADRLGIGRTLMYALVRSGEVESVRIGRLRRVPADALSVFVAALRTGRSAA